MSKLKTVVWEYVEVIDSIGNGSLSAREGDPRRRKLHNEILALTGLSTFEFGGLPAWFEIITVERAATRLYTALREQMSQKTQCE